MSSDLFEQAKAQCMTPLLPIAVCLLAPGREGKILCANEEFRKLFGTDVIGRKLADFYENSGDWDRIVTHLGWSARPGKQNTSEVKSRLMARHRPAVYKNFTRLLLDDAGESLGYLSFLIESDEEIPSGWLLHDSPVGIFKLDAEDHLTFCNQQMAKLLGREAKELLGMHLKDLVRDSREALALHQELDKYSLVTDRRLEFIRATDNFVGAVTVVRKPFDPGQPYAGCDGMVLDVTQEERRRRLIDEIPGGLYELELVRDNGSETTGIVVNCNAEFAHMHGYDGIADVVGRSIDDLQESRQAYLKALANNERGDGRGDHTSSEFRIRKRRDSDPDERWAAVSERLIRDGHGRVTSLLGVARDVTDERELRDWSDHLMSDIGTLLHSYSSSMMSLRHTLDLASEMCGDNPFGKTVRVGALEEELQNFEAPRRALVQALDEILAMRDVSHYRDAWKTEYWEKLEQRKHLLENLVLELPEDFRYATLREAAKDISAIFSRKSPGHLPRETQRRVRAAVGELQRLGTLLAILLAKGNLIGLGADLRTVRDSVVLRHRPSGPTEILFVEDLIRMALTEQAEYAQSRDVKFRHEFDANVKGARVQGRERPLIRALSSILNNAVKYSWHRTAGTFATIRLWADGDKAIFEVTNYGVPIPEDELQLIFKIGFRGRFSDDRQRVGTGIGLWDAERVARSHHGTLEVKSSPASGRDPGNFSQPFLTAVRLSLPLSSAAGG